MQKIPHFYCESHTDDTESHKKRTMEIRTNPRESSNYVSRGIRPKNINGSTWLTGPDFLWTRVPDVESIEQMVALDDPEVR